MDKYETLKQFFGYTRFKRGQAEVIDSLTGGRDALCVMPTGAGKSLCYQLPAVMLCGVSICISPLISLMKDQVSALTLSGVPAAFINSTLSMQQQYLVMERAQMGAYKLIYLAPERLLSKDIEELAKRLRISMVAVDEAHCISQWGQDFRPSYQRISEFIATLEHRPVIAALTATATERVREDIVCSLGLNEPLRMTTGFDRENLNFEVRRPKSKYKELEAFLKDYEDSSGIVYCLTRKTVEEVCARLQASGLSATRYHAGLSDSERRGNQDDFAYDRKRIMVATNAFGMGIDKSNVAFVVHYNMPQSVESYYQEAGRAGRDGERARCTLFYSGQDVRTNRYLIENSDEVNEELSAAEREEVRARNLELLKFMTFYATTQDCLRKYILNYFGEQAPEVCDNCSNCTQPMTEVDIAAQAQMIVSCVYRMENRGRNFGKATVADVLRGSRREMVTKWHLDTLSTYGLMAKTHRRDIVRIIDFLIERGYLMETGGEYPMLATCARSGEIVRGKPELTMLMPEPREAIGAPEASAANDAGVDDGLLKALKKLRSELAERASVPAYVVFSNTTLMDMCRLRPTNRSEFLRVTGVGEIKAERYGEVFINAIAEYLDGSAQKTAHSDDSVESAKDGAPGGEAELTVDRLRPFLKDPAYAETIHSYPVLRSTNDTAKRMALEGMPHLSAIIANEQTHGRGRYDRSFHSPPGSGVYMSFILPPVMSCTLMAAYAAVKTAEVIERVFGVDARIKWVNDIIVGGRKVGGILIEAVGDALVLGIGINVSTHAFPAELRHVAGCIAQKGAALRPRLAAELVNAVHAFDAKELGGELIAQYRRRCTMLNKRVNVAMEGRSFEAQAVDIDSEGRLLILTDEGEELLLLYGEVSVRGDE